MVRRWMLAFVLGGTFHGGARASVDELRLNESSFQIRFEGAARNDAAKIDRQFLHHVAATVRKYGYDRFLFRVAEGDGASFTTQGAAAYQPAKFVDGASHVRQAIVLCFKKPGAPPEAFDANLILEKPAPEDDPPPAASATTAVAPEAVAEVSPPAAPPPPVSPPVAPSPSPAFAPPMRERKGFAVSVGSASAAILRFNEARVYDSGASARGQIELEFERGSVLGLEYFDLREGAWGYRTGILIGSARSPTKLDLDFPGFSGSYAVTGSSRASLQMTAFYLSAEYSAENFYFPVGFNLSSPTFSPAVNSGTYDYSGGLGMQAGVGFRVTPVFSLELIYLMQSLQMKNTTGTVVMDYGTGYHYETLFNVKMSIPFPQGRGGP